MRAMWPTSPGVVMRLNCSSTTIMRSVGGTMRLPFSSILISPSLPDLEAPKLSRSRSSGFTASMRSRTLWLHSAT